MQILGGGLGDALILNSCVTTVSFPPKVLKIDANDETLCAVVILEYPYWKQMQGRSVLSARVVCAPKKNDLFPAEKGKN